MVLMKMSNTKLFLIYSILGTISILPLLILPAMIGVLVDELGVSESYAGWSASVNFLGGAVVAIIMAFRMHYLHLRNVTMFAMSITIIADLFSGLTGQWLIWFLMIRFIAGIGAGAVYTATLAAFARCDNCDRGFGIFVTLQFIVSGIGLYLLPVYSAALSVSGMFTVIAVFDFIGLLLIRHIPGRAIEETKTSDTRSELGILFSIVTIFAVMGFCFFETANTAQFTYVERLGVSLDFSADEIGFALLVGSLMGIPGAFSIVITGDRFGRLYPLLMGISIAIIGLIILISTKIFTFYLVASCLLGFAWAFCLPFIQGTMAALDSNGSVLAAGSSAATIGGAIGPGLAAMIIGEGLYHHVLFAAVILFLIAMSCFLLSQKLNKSQSVLGRIKNETA